MSASIDTSSTGFIENLMEKLCEEIRSGSSRTVYGELIAENVEAAIHSCFPLLRQTVGDTQIRSWINDFMRQHPCSEPQFFHIATEFVRFANASLERSEAQRSLMEYEWLLLATELDNASTPISEDEISVYALWQGKARLGVNPTLSEVGLPFDIDDVIAGKPIGKCDGSYNYAIYRSGKHRVYSQRLTDFDRWMLASIRDRQTINRALIEQAAHHETPDALAEEWLFHFCKTDAVIYIKK